jgi:hypothetical protein
MEEGGFLFLVRESCWDFSRTDLRDRQDLPEVLSPFARIGMRSMRRLSEFRA